MTRIGCFGDSFTANVRLPASYSFTEPLDYLFNRAGNRLEVLNFGTDGYGTDQAYLQYRNDTEALGLDTVVYVCCHNDPVDLIANQLYALTEDGSLKYLPRPETGLLTRLVRKSYLTYLFLTATATFDRQKAIAGVYGKNSDDDRAKAKEVEKRILKTDGARFAESEEGAAALRLFDKVLATWKAEVEARGQDFVIVLLPRRQSLRDSIRAVIAAQGIETIDLAESVSAEADDLSPLFFRKDSHWNEEGNKWAAVYLFKALSARAGLKNPGDDFIREALSDYYGAFDGEMLSEAWLNAGAPAPEPALAAEIRAKYTPLEEGQPPR